MSEMTTLKRKLEKAQQSADNGTPEITQCYLQATQDYAISHGLPYSGEQTRQIMGVAYRRAVEKELGSAERSLSLPDENMDPRLILRRCTLARGYARAGDLNPEETEAMDVRISEIGRRTRERVAALTF